MGGNPSGGKTNVQLQVRFGRATDLAYGRLVRGFHHTLIHHEGYSKKLLRNDKVRFTRRQQEQRGAA